MELDRLEWISQRNEEAIDPSIRIVDPHHHLWHRGGSRYLAEELREDTTRSHNVTNTVFVECKANYDRDRPKELQPVGETVFVEGEARRTKVMGGPQISGIVGFADLTLGKEVAEVLRAHEESGKGLFRGVRHATAWSDDPEISISHTKPTEMMMNTNEFHEGLSTLGQLGYSFDAWMYFNQLGELVNLAREYPTVPIILNHLGAPLAIGGWKSRGKEVDEFWRKKLRELSTCENIFLKVGGIGMDNYFGTGWTALSSPPSSETVAEFWRERVQWCIDLFSPGRCMFESNFPVDRQSLPYSVLWNAFQRIAEIYNNSEQESLFSQTACEVYKIT
ncbi:MAG: amidohydrolase family protein [Actinomycetota bacterium]|nr:amidohydrolase family protein [Actinomycetota bacterium]